MPCMAPAMAAEDSSSVYMQHTLHGARSRDEQDTDAAGFGQRVLLVLPEEPAGKMAHKASSDNGRAVNYCS